MMENEDNDARIIKSYRAKIVQLERQVQLLTKCTNIKAEAVTDIDNFVLEIVGEEEDSSPIERSHLRKWGKMLQEKIRNYNILTKQAENQKYFMECKYSGGTDSVQNVCNYSKNDDIPYLEVSTVLELENDLTHVYRNLYRLRTQLNANKSQVKDTNFLLLTDITINNITKVLNEMVELSLVLPKKVKGSSEEVSSSYGQYYNPMNMSSSEMMSKLPRIGNSKTSKEVEDAIKQFVKAFHAQKTLFELDLQMKQEELNIMSKTSTFYNSYFSEMLKEIEQKYNDFTGQVTPSSVSSKSVNQEIIEDIVQSFEDFDRESNEENLRHFLMTFKDNIYSLQEDKSEPTKKKNRPNVTAKSYYERFKAHVEEIQTEFLIRKNEFIEKMYNLNPEVEKYEHIEPFISYTPYDNSSSMAKKQSVKKRPTSSSVNSSVSSLRSSSMRGSTVINPMRKEIPLMRKSNLPSISDSSPDLNIKEFKEVKEIRDVTPKVGSSSNSTNSSKVSQNANVKELAQRVEDQRRKVDDLSENLMKKSLSDMQKFALQKQFVSTLNCI
ncbi:predicted protein [Naegleria gruberi]|uniref:Predicted protein n=1 Tax=Naegleria gruberi TaxID=5762 RepID=D2W326_NAEGR|nr:uncharacterized protein NAEGRDRAFT_75796 [Naegleria gruberi]EFC36538.1 predicted protein [Naegleria gruberi]|eukprot:XP_002669282.1 predicted protein [Naegleria gruberi strain NEG-M]